MVYNFIFAFAAVCNFITYLAFPSRKKLYYFFLCFMFCFAAFRWEVGCDWDGYRIHAESYGPLPFEQVRKFGEQGYWLLVLAINRIGWLYPTINIFACLVFFAGVNALARRQPDPLLYLTLAFPILITGIAMSAVRQEFAIGIICYAFIAFAENKLFRYVLFVGVAALFHKSAAAFLMFVPYLLPISRNYRIITVIVALPIVVLMGASDTASGYAEMYIGSRQEAAGGPVRAFMVSATGATFYMIRNRWRTYSPEDYLLINSLVPALLVVFPISLVSSVIGDRFGYYLMLIAFIIQAKAYLIVDRKLAMPALIMPLLIGATMLLVWTQFSSLFAQCYVPYRTWWTG